GASQGHGDRTGPPDGAGPERRRERSRLRLLGERRLPPVRIVLDQGPIVTGGGRVYEKAVRERYRRSRAGHCSGKPIIWGQLMSDLRLIAKVAFVATLFAMAAALSGCASNIKQMEEVQATGGTPFTQALTEEYRSFVAHEKDERDWSAADYFAIKGLAAAGGQVVLPEEVGDVGEHGPALTDGRARLMAALDGFARDSNPQVAARAQRAFDCWNHEAEEDNWYDSITDEHVKPCRDEFEAAMAQLAPPAMVSPNPNAYIVLFDFD